MATAVDRSLVDIRHMQLLTTLNLFSLLEPPQAQVKDGDDFDFIIIGSGVGSVLASRVTENENCIVMLIEAGDNPSAESMLPGLFFALQDSYQDWLFRSQPELASQSQQEDYFHLSAGKSLGGSSAINHFIFLQSTHYDFDSWAEYLKNPSWKFENILPYYKISESLQDEQILNSKYAKYHGTKGPNKTSKERKIKSKNYLESYAETGTPAVLDLNGNQSLGYTESLFSIGDGIRQSTYQAYLRKLRNRKNLFVLRKTIVLKINIENKVARSVNVDIGGKNIITLKARKEIIVSAGVYNSPKLLMLLEIGPKDHLKEMNIELVSDLRVGLDMQDHVAVAFAHKMDRSIEISELPRLTEISFPILIGGVTLDTSKDYPEYQIASLLFTHDTLYITAGCSILFNYRNKICDRLQFDSISRSTMLSLVTVLHPESRGTVKLRSSSPKDDTVISENFYDKKSDLDNMVSYIQDFLRVSNTTYFRRVDSDLVDLKLEQCKDLI